jgi:hypothetical protein
MGNKRTELSFESREVWRIVPAPGGEIRPCPICPNAVPMILAEDLAKSDHRSPREIYRAIEQGRLHFLESSNAQVFVCLASFAEARTK